MARLIKSLTVAVGMVFFAAAAMAEVSIWSAQKANQAVQSGALVLIDIRTPGEWDATGVAKGAWPMDMTSKTFIKQLQAVLARNQGKEIGFICATGGRTAYLTKYLDKAGVQHSIDVSEGMNGSRKGAGWVKAGLPVVSAKQAQHDMPKDLTAR